MSLCKPESFTWDMCYVINEVCQEGKYPVEDYEFDVLNQETFLSQGEEEESNLVYLVEEDEPCWC